MATIIKNWVIRQALDYSKRTIILTLIITGIIGSGIRFIFVDDNVMNMLPKDIESRRIWDEIIEEFQYSDFLFVAFGRDGENVLTAENLALTWDLTDSLELIPHVDEVLSLSTMTRMDNEEDELTVDNLMPNRELSVLEIESLAKYLNDNPNMSSQMLGKNGDYINIIIRPIADADFRSMVSSVREITAPFEKNYDFHFGGQPYIAGKIPDLILTETRTLMLVGLMIMSIILLANLRSLPALGMILSVIFMSMLSMMGFLGWAYHFIGTPHFYFTLINSSMPLVLLTIANSDGVHVLSRFFREARTHKDVKQAITLTMNQLLLPIFLTSITTTAAFLTMLTSPIAAMTGYGLSIGFGILWAWILSSTFLPSLINLKKWDFSTAALTKSSFLENIVHILSQKILKRPRTVLVVCTAIVLISFLGIRYINVEVNIVNLFKPGNTIRESTFFLDREMAGSMNLLMKIKGDLKKPETLNQMLKIQEYLETIPTVNTTISIADVIQEMHKIVMDNKSEYKIIPDTRGKVNNLFTTYFISGNSDDFESLVNDEYEVGLITTMMHTVSTMDVVRISDDIEEFLQTEIADLNIEISGLMMFLKDLVSLVVRSSVTSIFVSIGVILCISWIFFRSWKFGILSVIPLSSAVMLNFGLMGWFGVDLTHFTALLTSIIIGVGVDFAIHYISEFMHYSNNGINETAISQQVMENVGYPILLDVFSNMGFAALIFSSLIPIIHMGGLMVFAMLSTSFGTLTILAAIMEITKHKLKQKEAL